MTPTNDQVFTTDRDTAAARLRISRCINGLLTLQPFFGIAAMSMLPPVPDHEKATIAADGVNIYYNPKWTNETQSDDLTQAVAHIVTACVLKHHTRRGERSYGRWQKASRLVTQHILLQEGIAQPENGLGLNMTIVDAYNSLPEEPEEPQSGSTPQTGDGPQDPSLQPTYGPGPGQDNDPNKQGQNPGQPPPGQNGPPGGQQDQPNPQQGQGDDPPQGQGQGKQRPNQNGSGQQQPQEKNGQNYDDPQKQGEVMDSPKPSADGDAEDSSTQNSQRQEEYRWDNIAHQALQISKAQGNQPGNLKSLIDSSHNPRIDWTEELRSLMTDHSDTEKSWNHPDRRSIARGLYQPGNHAPSINSICFAIDTSASLSQRDLENVWPEILGSVDQLDIEQIRIIQCDTNIQQDDQYDKFDMPEQLIAHGRGGTDFRPIFEILEDEPPQFLIYMTDLYCNRYPEFPPEYPVIWVCTAPQNTDDPPFGERIDLPNDDTQ